MTQQNIQPGGIKIESISLISIRSKKYIDLKELLIEFSIFENIRQPFMSIDLVIMDSLALTTRFPIVGNEYVDITFSVPEIPFSAQAFKKRFRLLAIKKLEVGNQQRFASYILRCFDVEYFNNLITKVRKSYSGIPVSGMVESLFKNYLLDKTSLTIQNPYSKIFPTSNKLTVSPTDGTPQLVVPAMSPAETIFKLFGRYAKSKDYPLVSNFVFFSNRDGYFFKTLEEMMDLTKIKQPVDRYYWTEKDTPITSKSDVRNLTNMADIVMQKPKEWLKISDFQIVNKLNVEESIVKGMYDSNVYYINPNTSLYGRKTYSYNYDYTKFERISRYGAAKTIFEDSDLANLKGESRHYYIPTNSGDQNLSIDFEDPRYGYLALQNASFAMLDNVTLNLTIPGDNTRKVGDVIEVELPEFGATDDVIGEIDAYLSGYYLVVGLRHIYNTRDGYYCVMQCVKNCFEQPLKNGIGEVISGVSIPIS